MRSYLRHFWSHWPGPGFELTGQHLDHLVSVYAEPGAFTASIGWYRARAGAVARSLAEQTPRPADRIGVPTTVLWPGEDPVFPSAWSDRLDDFFANVRVQYVDRVGHFTPLECPRDFAAALATTAGASLSI